MHPAAPAADAPLYRFALLADTHLTDWESTAPLQWAVERLNEPGPDFVVSLGDMTDGGSEGQQALFLGCVRGLQSPHYALAGNHDLVSPGALERHVAEVGPTNQRWRVAGHHCLALDTTNRYGDPENWHGKVEEEALVWLRQALDSIPPAEPILLFTHHGLVGRADDLSCDVENAEEVLALLEGHNLRAAVAGHSHRLTVNWWGAVPFLCVPALSVTRRSYGVPPGFLTVEVRRDGIRARFEVGLWAMGLP